MNGQTYIKHKRTGKRYLLTKEYIFQATCFREIPWNPGKLEVIPVQDTRNGERMFEYQALHPKTGTPWQARRTGLADLFEREAV